MPPRLPFVLVFFAGYFAVIAGGGAEALARLVTLPLPAEVSAEGLQLSIAECIAALAAFAAAPDAALRPPHRIWDRLLSVAVAAGAIAIAVLAPEVATLGYGVLTAIAVGDALTALFWSRRKAAAM